MRGREGGLGRLGRGGTFGCWVLWIDGGLGLLEVGSSLRLQLYDLRKPTDLQIHRSFETRV